MAHIRAFLMVRNARLIRDGGVLFEEGRIF